MKVIECKRQRSHMKTLLFQRRASRKFHVSQNAHDRKAFDPLPATQKATPTSSFCSSA